MHLLNGEYVGRTKRLTPFEAKAWRPNADPLQDLPKQPRLCRIIENNTCVEKGFINKVGKDEG